MIQVHTAEGTIVDRVALDFSNEEIVRIKEICEELRKIFMAQSVGISLFELSAGMPVNYQIEISGCPARLVFE